MTTFAKRCPLVLLRTDKQWAFKSVTCALHGFGLKHNHAAARAAFVFSTTIFTLGVDGGSRTAQECASHRGALSQLFETTGSTIVDSLLQGVVSAPSSLGASSLDTASLGARVAKPKHHETRETRGGLLLYGLRVCFPDQMQQWYSGAVSSLSFINEVKQQFVKDLVGGDTQAELTQVLRQISSTIGNGSGIAAEFAKSLALLSKGDADFNIPELIKSLGTDIETFYSDLLRNGSSPLLWSKLMLVGSGRVGKTSLLRSLTGQDFEHACKSTRGIDSCSVNIQSWSHGQNTEAAKVYHKHLANQLAVNIAEAKLRGQLGATKPLKEATKQSVTDQPVTLARTEITAAMATEAEATQAETPSTPIQPTTTAQTFTFSGASPGEFLDSSVSSSVQKSWQHRLKRIRMWKGNT